MMLDDITKHGRSFLRLSETDSECVRDIFRHGREFFKQRNSVLDRMPWLYTGVENGLQRTHSGFNLVGEEFAGDHRYPDIMESFNLMPSEFKDDQMSEMMGVEFIRTLLRFRSMVVKAANSIFDGFNYDFEKFSILRLSYNRVGEYKWLDGRSPLEDREFLLDPHEDGHFLTFIASDVAGFVGRQGMSGDWEFLKPSATELIVFSSLPYCVWAGSGEPYYHGVKRCVDGIEVDDRLSLGVFVSPNVEMEILNEDGISVGQVVNASQERFGLPNFSDNAFTNEKTGEFVRGLYDV